MCHTVVNVFKLCNMVLRCILLCVTHLKMYRIALCSIAMNLILPHWIAHSWITLCCIVLYCTHWVLQSTILNTDALSVHNVHTVRTLHQPLDPWNEATRKFNQMVSIRLKSKSTYVHAILLCTAHIPSSFLLSLFSFSLCPCPNQLTYCHLFFPLPLLPASTPPILTVSSFFLFLILFLPSLPHE